VAAIVVTGHFMALSNACPIASQISNWRCFVWVNLMKLESYMVVGFQLYQPQNAINFLPHREHLFS
jgi:hypothetical protein